MTPHERLAALKAKAKSEPEPQTEIEIAGVSFKGGKIFVIITALSTLGGGAWGAFEFYNDYRNMKAAVEEFVAPDLSGFQEQLSILEERIISLESVTNERMKTLEVSVEESRGYTRDIKDDLRKDIDRIETLVENTSNRVKSIQDESFTAIRDMEKQTRDTIDIADERFNNKRDALSLDTGRKLKELEERMNNTIQRALDNPLSN